MWMRIIVVFFVLSSDPSVRARTFVRNVRWGSAQFDRLGHVAGGLGAIRGVCRAWQAFLTFLALALGMDPR